MTEYLKIQMNEATRNQIFGVILMDCLRKCNAMKLPEAEYEIQLRAMLKSRINSQQELPV